MQEVESQSGSLAIATDRLFVGGKWVAPAGTGMFDAITPSTEAVYLRAAEATAAAVDRVAQASLRLSPQPESCYKGL